MERIDTENLNGSATRLMLPTRNTMDKVDIERLDGMAARIELPSELPIAGLSTSPRTAALAWQAPEANWERLAGEGGPEGSKGQSERSVAAPSLRGERSSSARGNCRKARVAEGAEAR